MLDYYLYRLKYRYAPYLNLKKPIDVTLELSSRCNIKCQYCYHESTPSFKQGFMNENIARNIIDQAARIGVKSIKFNWRGESTLHPQYFDIINKAHSYSVKTGCFVDRIANTNFMFRPDRLDIFRALTRLTKVKVSLDSFHQSVLDKQRKGADVNRIVTNIDYFYNKKGNTKLVVQAIRTKLNKDEDLLYKLKRRWPDAELSVRDMVGGRNDKSISELEDKKRSTERKPCLQAFCRLIFDHEGNAHPCCPDIYNNMNLGNINNKSLLELFNSNFAKTIRTQLKNGQMFDNIPCKSCSSFESYKGYKHPFSS